MAGIGFKLQEALISNKGIQGGHAFAAAALISSGPWILTAICVAMIGWIWNRIGGIDLQLFKASCVYAFAIAQIVSGVVQLALSRYLSDRLYEEDDEAILPAWARSTLVCVFFGCLFGFIFQFSVDFSLRERIVYVVLCGSLSGLWNTTTLLSVLRDYSAVVLAFLAGMIVGVLFPFLLSSSFGVFVPLLSLLAGVGFTFGLLTRRLFVELTSYGSIKGELRSHFVKYKSLVFLGGFLALGAWIDKFMFWLIPNQGQTIIGGFAVNNFYDSPVFYALLSVIPAFALFLIHVETSFYIAYKNFFGCILNKSPFREINSQKNLMIKEVNSNALKLLTTQGFISLIFIFLPDILPGFLPISNSTINIFQILILATMTHVFFIFINVLLQYLDFLKWAAYLGLFFFASNALATLVSIVFLDFRFWGYGYFFASLLSLVAAWITLQKGLANLEYHVFMGPKSRL